MRKTACVAALVLAVLGLGAQVSGTAEAPIVDVGQVDMSAKANSPIALAPAGSITVITADDIERSGSTNVADALENTPGTWINRSGPGGAVASASIAGSTSNQVLVIVDGVRQNDAREGAPDLAQIPTEDIEKIEVLRSGASAVYGADAMGGVIVITTKKSGASRLSISVTDSAYPTASPQNGPMSYLDGQSLGIDAGSKLGLADLAFSAQAERASNAYSYSSNGSTETRDNAGFWSGAANLSVGAPLADGRLTVLAAGSYQNADVPGSLSFPSPQSEQKNTALNGSLGWSSDALAGGALALDLQAHGGFSRLDYADPSYAENDRYDMTSGGIDLRATDTLSSAVDLGFGASTLYEAANSSAFDSDPNGQPTRFSLGAYVEPEFRIGDRLKITPALRYDWNDNYVAGLSAMLDAVWKASDAIDLRFSGGRSYRAPTFNELYWPYEDFGGGYSYQGNPNLKPEVAWSGEVGLDFHAGAFSLSANASARYVSDLIEDSSDPNSIPINIDTAFIPSATVEASYKIGPATLKANYEFLYPLDLSNGQTIWDDAVLTSYSQHKAGGSADFMFGPAEAGVSANYWSNRTDSYGDSLSGALIVDLNAAYKVQKNLRFTLAVENLLNANYQVNYDYPMPGLKVKVGAKIDLY
jgi:outer membrane cobalamin receptor